MKRVLVTGASGFIGAHLIARLKTADYWVRGVSRSNPPYRPSAADEYLLLDLRRPEDCRRAMRVGDGTVDEVYHLAADMGGIGYITTAECDVMRNNALMNIHVLDAAARSGVSRYFFASSVCVYRDMRPGEEALREEDVLPARPDNAYGWEKLFSEQMLARCAAKQRMSVRIGRFQTSYGPQGAWTGGREKAPAALCRKVAEAVGGGRIQVWGDGSAIRSYLYVDDLTDAVFLLMNSDLEGPVNIGSPEYLSVKELAERIIRTSSKRLTIEFVPGPVGVHARNFSNERMYSIGWKPAVPLDAGLKTTYAWIQEQVAQSAVQQPAEPHPEVRS